MLPERNKGPLVAIMDSGVGGLPYLEASRRHLPRANFVYLADREGFPYGTKTREEVEAIVRDRVRRLVSAFAPDALVIACNTASQAALAAVRADHPGLPVIGTVPAVKPAASESRSKVIGILATERSVVDPYLDELEDRFASTCRVERRGAQDLVAFVERRFLEAEPSETMGAIGPHVAFLVEKGVDEIVLACTHFLHVAKEIEVMANELAARRGGSAVKVVDSREGVARRLRDLIDRGDLIDRDDFVDRGDFDGRDQLLGEGGTRPEQGHRDRFYLTGPEPFEAVYAGFARRYGLEGPFALDGARR
ncbi:MAG TPA: aspartate/glutamate racemase family protein [Rectinemataceae bacterium]|nr:aspartate/glutamate racemase family protein [Rectinemataceae bacterium]